MRTIRLIDCEPLDWWTACGIAAGLTARTAMAQLFMDFAAAEMLRQECEKADVYDVVQKPVRFGSLTVLFPVSAELVFGPFRKAVVISASAKPRPDQGEVTNEPPENAEVPECHGCGYSDGHGENRPWVD